MTPDGDKTKGRSQSSECDTISDDPAARKLSYDNDCDSDGDDEAVLPQFESPSDELGANSGEDNEGSLSDGIATKLHGGGH